MLNRVDVTGGSTISPSIMMNLLSVVGQYIDVTSLGVQEQQQQRQSRWRKRIVRTALMRRGMRMSKRKNTNNVPVSSFPSSIL